MDGYSTENDNATTRTTHTGFTGATTTLPSDAKPFSGSTVSDNGRKEYTATASRSHIRCLLNEMTEEQAERLVSEFLDSWVSHIAGSSDVGTGQLTYRKTSSNDGLTGPCPEEAEPCEP